MVLLLAMQITLLPQPDTYTNILSLMRVNFSIVSCHALNNNPTIAKAKYRETV
jgi:hypothetical protein